MSGGHTLTVGGVCAGVGGLELGLERVGWQTRWLCESEPYCRHVLAHHWPNVPIFHDIRYLDPPGVDVLSAGFPCQPASLAGQARGTADQRWLWPAIARVIRMVRPRLVLMENVPSLLQRGMGHVLGDLAALGYDAEWDCLPASAFGAPHTRDRLFIVAHPEGDGLAGRIFEPAAPWRTEAVARGRAWWQTEPAFSRVADGVPRQLDRVWVLGNAVIPLIAETIAGRVMELLVD